MLILVFILLVVIAMFVFGFIGEETDYPGRNSAIAFLIFALIWFGLVQFNAHVLQTKLVEHSKITNIVALQDNRGTSGGFSGAFFIGAGYVEENLYYYYIEQTEDGLHIGPKIPAEKAYIQKFDGQPHMIHIWEDREGESIWKYHIADAHAAVDKYVFYVPETTIVTDFKVDLQ